MKWYKPYKRTKNGLHPNDRIPHLKECCGVYMIRSEQNGEIVYIGHSKSSVYKTMFRHFQEWDDPSQYRATYSPGGGYRVRIIPTRKDRADKLERYLIRRIKPRDAKQKYPDYEPAKSTRKKIRGDLEKAGVQVKDLPDEREEAPF